MCLALVLKHSLVLGLQVGRFYIYIYIFLLTAHLCVMIVCFVRGLLNVNCSLDPEPKIRSVQLIGL